MSKLHYSAFRAMKILPSVKQPAYNEIKKYFALKIIFKSFHLCYLNFKSLRH